MLKFKLGCYMLEGPLVAGPKVASPTIAPRGCGPPLEARGLNILLCATLPEEPPFRPSLARSAHDLHVGGSVMPGLEKKSGNNLSLIYNIK